MARPSTPPRPWRPCGLVSLLTDYGLEDPYAGILRGVLHRDAPHLRAVLDLTHGVPPGDVALAGFLLERSWAHFPAGTVHLAVVDPGVGGERGVLLVEARGHVFVAPDNGLLAPLIASEPLAVVRLADERAPVRGASTTFHGRDRLAPLAARLAEGEPPASFGEFHSGHRRLEPRHAVREADGSIRCEVVHVDRFGNLITSAPFTLLSAQGGSGWCQHWECRAAGRTLALAHTYADAPADTPVALVDSYDRLEIALRNGSAARALGLALGASVVFVPRVPDARGAAPARSALPARASRGEERPR